jgi:hypothetical protein
MTPDEQREAHRILLAMDPSERTTALAAATIEGHGVVRQVCRLIALIEVMGAYLDEPERVALADSMVDSAVSLVTKWH